MLVIGVDPGSASAAYAVHRDVGGVTVHDVPTVDGNVDAASFARVLRDLRNASSEEVEAVIELVSPAPRQGLSSTGKFMKSAGLLEGVILALEIPLHRVPPARWKRTFRLKGGDKEPSRALAIRLYPGVKGMDRKKDHGRAEALLLAHWLKNGGTP